MEKLTNGNFYHLYNRGINSGDIFFSRDHAVRFIQKFRYYTTLVLQPWAWCIMRNHFHVLVLVRTDDNRRGLLQRVKSSGAENLFYESSCDSVKAQTASKVIAHWLNSHTRYINANISRTGPLFEGRYKRILVDSYDYLRYLICYIHRNPVHHGIEDRYENYPFSSYREILSRESTFVPRKKVFKLFGGKANFLTAHQEVKKNIEYLHLE